VAPTPSNSNQLSAGAQGTTETPLADIAANAEKFPRHFLFKESHAGRAEGWLCRPMSYNEM
jgi:hypothetical protein